MVCYCCNRRLSNAESTRKFSSGVFTEMCDSCLSSISEDVQFEEDGGDIDEDQEEE